MRELSQQIIEHVRRAEEPAGVRASASGAPESPASALAAEVIRIARTAASIHLAQVARHQSERSQHEHAATADDLPAHAASEPIALAREHRS